MDNRLYIVEGLPLNPVVIYLKNDDISLCVKRALAEREGWLDSVIDYHVNSAYGRSIGASGFEGYIHCLEERQKRELDILERLSVKTVLVDNPHRNWAGAYEEIRRILI